MEETDLKVEEMKLQLNESRIKDFVETLKSDDLPASRLNTITLISRAFEQLHEIESSFLDETVNSDDICPCCIVTNTKDVTRVEALIDSFTSYIKSDGA